MPEHDVTGSAPRCASAFPDERRERTARRRAGAPLLRSICTRSRDAAADAAGAGADAWAGVPAPRVPAIAPLRAGFAAPAGDATPSADRVASNVRPAMARTIVRLGLGLGPVLTRASRSGQGVVVSRAAHGVGAR
ncbi:hypothetical protein NX794_15960 [Streptomyces sp. LP11]|uniref:Uncharacterized protein n=1 Tax=Streptomyces pyxinicus TaxID=2970331 RepID=A0ABT2B2E5_9ACTN|nr:hypothetical protein [Streptomyces sp. LP11]MCS0602695.1 hypothetical protein [Streptomyces sp. LP11]